MKSVKQFNGLNGTVVSREKLIQLLNTAKSEDQPIVATRIQNVLAHNSGDEFVMEIDTPAMETMPSYLMDCLDCEPGNDPNGLGKPFTPNDVYQMITDRFLQMLEKANAKDFKKTWKNEAYGTGYTIPFNFQSKKRYRGVNVFLLTNFEPLENPFFLTFKQVEDLKGNVRKGSKGFPVVYFTELHKIVDASKNIDFGTYDKKKAVDFANKNGLSVHDIFTIPILKYYNVFNGKDIDGIDFNLDNFKVGYIDIELPAVDLLEIPEAIIKNYPKPAPILKHGGSRAYHSGNANLVQMPQVAHFDTIQDYYRVLFHEYAHSTGTPNRLNRKLGNAFGSPDYAFEELIAEWGATFLSAEAGIIWHTHKNHASYIKGWNSALTAIKNDNKFVMRACTAAQKACDFILQFDEMGDPLYFNDLKKEVPVKVKKEKSEKTAKSITSENKEETNPKIKVTERKRRKKPTEKSTQLALFGAKKGLKAPFENPDILQPEVTVIPEEIATGVKTETTVVPGTFSDPVKSEVTVLAKDEKFVPGSYAAKRAQGKIQHESYRIDNLDISEFLGKIEKKKKESVVVTLAGGEGSMKTRMLFQLINAFGQNYRCGHASMEEHPDSELYDNKADEYLNEKARKNLFSPEIKSIAEFDNLVRNTDVIFIDSFSKLRKLHKDFGVDEDLRKKYDGKLFIVIFQLTVDGKMRGGSESQFDGDIILFTEKCADYRNNYVFAGKNRYQSKNLDELKFNIFKGKIIRPEPETIQLQPQETPKLKFKIIN